MGIVVYDLAGAEPERRFSPFCWRARMALAHKGLEAEFKPWRFVEKEVLSFSGQGRVPVLDDGGTVVSDSWAIAQYLEETYPDRPSLFPPSMGSNGAAFVKHWTETTVLPGLARMIVLDVHDHLDAGDQAYFRESREQRFGQPLEALVADRETRLPAFRQSLEPARQLLANSPYLSGDSPAFADHVLFGAFQWARCASPLSLLDVGDPVAEWRTRMMDAYGGVGARALGYPC